MCQTFGFKTLPLLPYRPWKNILGGVSFMYDYVLGFISAFYDEVYPEYAKLLKILMVEGVFYQKENLVELTDVCAELDKQRLALNKFKTSLAPEGEGGIMFENLMNENLLNPRDKAKLDSLIKSLETDAALILAQWCSSSRSVELILKGIITGARNSRYDTLSNLSTIQGRLHKGCHYGTKGPNVKKVTAHKIPNFQINGRIIFFQVLTFFFINSKIL